MNEKSSCVTYKNNYSFLFVILKAIEHATYVHDIAHVIIDNMQFMMGISEEPRQFDK
jgi:hypothetical protein